MVKAYLCHNQTFTEMKKFFRILAVALAFVAAFSSCKKEEDTISNTMTVRGQTYEIVHAICANMQGFCNVDVDTEGGVLHGHGGFESSLIGKTTDLKGDFFLSFNPQQGPSIDPVIKSGTCKITEVKGGLNLIVDAVEQGGDKFKMSVFLEDMGENF